MRERAIRLVTEAREQDEGLSLKAAVRRVGLKPDTLRGWVKQVDVD